MNTDMKNIKQKGFTLIEIMIAVVVFSFGLLAVAGVMTVAVKNNHNGFMRSQASFLASSMLDMMTRNDSRKLYDNSYDGTYSGYSDISAVCHSAACTMDELVDRDVQLWSNQLTQILPNSEGEISCQSRGATLGVCLNVNDACEPYNGFCTITITWDESSEASASSQQTLTLIGKP